MPTQHSPLDIFKAYSSLFIYHNNNIVTILLIYVDEILAVGNNYHFISYLITRFGHKFVIKDLDSLHYFLGVELRPFFSGIVLSQTRYIQDLTWTKIFDSSSIATPMVLKEKDNYWYHYLS